MCNGSKDVRNLLHSNDRHHNHCNDPNRQPSNKDPTRTVQIVVQNRFIHRTTTSLNERRDELVIAVRSLDWRTGDTELRIDLRAAPCSVHEKEVLLSLISEEEDTRPGNSVELNIYNGETVNVGGDFQENEWEDHWTEGERFQKQ
jgi:hypothetical protein